MLTLTAVTQAHIAVPPSPLQDTLSFNPYFPSPFISWLVNAFLAYYVCISNLFGQRQGINKVMIWSFFHSNRHYQDSEGTQSTIWGDSSGDTLHELEEAGRGRPPYQTCLLGSILRLPQPKLSLTSWWLLNWSAEAPAILKHLDLVFAPSWLFLCGQLSSLLDLM